MKELITASTIRRVAATGENILEFSRNNSIVTPEAKDVARALKIELKASDYTVTKKIYRQFCGVRPNFSMTDRHFLVFQIKEAILKQLPVGSIKDEALINIIENTLDHFQAQKRIKNG